MCDFCKIDKSSCGKAEIIKFRDGATECILKSPTRLHRYVTIIRGVVAVARNDIRGSGFFRGRDFGHFCVTVAQEPEKKSP